MPKTYLVFVIQAHDGDVDGRLQDVVTVELIDDDFENAEARAKVLVKRRYYRLSMIIEKNNEQYTS